MGGIGDAVGRKAVMQLCSVLLVMRQMGGAFMSHKSYIMLVAVELLRSFFDVVTVLLPMHRPEAA